MLFLGTLVTTSAAWLHGTAAALLLYERTGSSAAVAAVTVAQYTPQLVLAPLSGTWADRYDPTRQMIIGRCVCVLGALVTLGWFWFRWDEASSLESTVAVSAAAFVLGTGFVVGGPAIQAVVPTLVRPAELGAAMALNTAPMTIARIVGPALGAVLAVGAGPLVTFGCSAAGQAVFIPLVLLARLPRTPRTRGAGERNQIREALSFLRVNRRVAAGLLGALAVGLGSEPVLTLAPALVESLREGPGAVGLLTTCFGVGAAVTLLMLGTVAARLAPGRMVGVGIGCLVVGLAGCAVLPWLWACLFAGLCMGVGFSSGITGLSTIVQGGTPDALRGRVSSLWLLAFIGSRPLSVGMAGLLADFTNVRLAFAFVALLVALIGLVATTGCRVRARA